MKITFKVISITLILIILLSGCINPNPNSEEKKGLIHYFWFNDVNNEYIYFPLIVDDKNETIIKIHEYYVISGNGNIEDIIINNTMMLNISVYSSNIEIKAESDVESKYSQNITYDISFINDDIKNGSKYVKVFYSGKNLCYMASMLSIEKGNIKYQLNLGPIYLSNGWNIVQIYYKTIYAD